MTVETEESRAEQMSQDDTLNNEQRDAALDAANTIAARRAAAAYAKVKARTAVYEKLGEDLREIVDAIAANRLPDTINAVNEAFDTAFEAVGEGDEA